MGTIFRVPVVVELKIAKIWTLQLDGGVEYLVQSGLQVGRRGQSRAQAHSGLRRAKPDFVDRRPSWPKEWQPHPEAKGSPVWVNRVQPQGLRCPV